jgi:hypothetical protein
MLAQMVFTAVNCASGTCAVPVTAQMVTSPSPQVVTVVAPQVVTLPVIVADAPVGNAVIRYKRGLFGRLKPVSARVELGPVGGSGSRCANCK